MMGASDVLQVVRLHCSHWTQTCEVVQMGGKCSRGGDMVEGIGVRGCGKKGSGDDSNGEKMKDDDVYISVDVMEMGGSGVVVAMVGSWGMGAREWG